MQRGLITVTLAIALGAAAMGAAAAWKLTSMHYVIRIAKAAQDQAQAVAESNARATAAGFAYESWKASQKPRIVTITRTVEHEIQAAPVWAAAALPDGVRDALAAAATEAGATEPAAAVPGLPASAPGDQSGLGFVLRGRPRLGGGLQGSAAGSE